MAIRKILIGLGSNRRGVAHVTLLTEKHYDDSAIGTVDLPIDIISTRISSLSRRAAHAAATPDTSVANAGVSVRNQMCDNCLKHYDNNANVPTISLVRRDFLKDELEIGEHLNPHSTSIYSLVVHLFRA